MAPTRRRSAQMARLARNTFWWFWTNTGIPFSFGTAVLLISHDRYLIDALATQIWEGNPDESQLFAFNGTYSQMKEEREKEAWRLASQQTAVVSEARVSNNEVRRVKSKETKEERRKIAQLQELENAIADYLAFIAAKEVVTLPERAKLQEAFSFKEKRFEWLKFPRYREPRWRRFLRRWFHFV